MTEVQLLPQMGIKQCHTDPKDVIREDVAQKFLVRIYGEAVAIKTKEARSGDTYSYLIGEFGGTNHKGEEFTSEKLFLPAGIQEKIEVQLSQANGKAVKFGYDVFAVADNKITSGYRYAARTVLQTEATDRLATIKTEVTAVPLPGSEVVETTKKTTAKK